jgi:hypothetical protein
MARDDVAHRADQGAPGDVERHAVGWRPVEQHLGALLHAVQHRAQLRPQARSAGQRLDEHHPARVRVVRERAQQLGEGRTRGARPLPLLQRARHPSQRPLGDVLVRGQQARFAVLELLVESGARDAGAGADLGDAEALVAGLPRQLDDRVDQPLALRGPHRCAVDGDSAPLARRAGRRRSP